MTILIAGKFTGMDDGRLCDQIQRVLQAANLPAGRGREGSAEERTIEGVFERPAFKSYSPGWILRPCDGKAHLYHVNADGKLVDLVEAIERYMRPLLLGGFTLMLRRRTDSPFAPYLVISGGPTNG